MTRYIIVSRDRLLGGMHWSGTKWMNLAGTKARVYKTKNSAYTIINRMTEKEPHELYWRIARIEAVEAD